MAEQSGIFPSVNGDRRYFTSFFAAYFADFISNGIYPNPSTQCQVLANNDMTVTLKPGNAYINGYKYINDSDKSLSIETADGVLKRIDRIVLRYTTLNREIKSYVKKGTFASTPVAPSLQRDADMWELGVADIFVNNGAISITQSNITDLRLNNTYCGIVHGVINQVDTTTIFNQFQAWYLETVNDATTDIATMLSAFQSSFNAWFANLQDILDENTAGNLLNKINDLILRMTEAETEIMLKVDKSDYVKSPGYATSTGSANTYIVTLDPSPTAYIDGMGIVVKINIQNTGASTINANGLGAKSILDSKGNAMTAGKLKANTPYTMRYNGVNFILQGEGASGNATASDLLSGKTASTDAGDIIGSLSISKLIKPTVSSIDYAIVNDVITETTISYYDTCAGDHNDNVLLASQSYNIIRVYLPTGALNASIAFPLNIDFTSGVKLWTHYTLNGKAVLCLIAKEYSSALYHLWIKDITVSYSGVWIDVYSGLSDMFPLEQGEKDNLIISIGNSTEKTVVFKWFSALSGAHIKTLTINYPANATSDYVSSYTNCFSSELQQFNLTFYTSSRYNYTYDANGNLLTGPTTADDKYYNAYVTNVNEIITANSYAWYVLDWGGALKRSCSINPRYASKFVANPSGDLIGVSKYDYELSNRVLGKDGKLYSSGWRSMPMVSPNFVGRMARSKNGRIYLCVATSGIYKGYLANRILTFPNKTGIKRIVSTDGLAIELKEVDYWSGSWSRYESGSQYNLTTNTKIKEDFAQTYILE